MVSDMVAASLSLAFVSLARYGLGRNRGWSAISLAWNRENDIHQSPVDPFNAHAGEMVAALGRQLL